MAANSKSNGFNGVSSSTTVNKLAEKLSWLVAIILIVLPFHAFLTTWAGSNFGYLDVFRIWEEILILILLPSLIWLIVKTQDLRRWLYQSWVVRLYGVYIVLHLILAAWAYSHHTVNQTALIYGLLINLRFIGFFIICALLATTNGFLNRHWKTILIVPSVVVIFFGLLQKFLLDINFLRHFGYGSKTIPAYSTVDNNLAFRRLQSTLRGPNPLGAYLVLIAAYFAATIDRRHYNYKSLGIMLAGLIVMFYTYSRSAWLGVLISLGFLFLWHPYIRNRNLIFAFIALVVMIGGLFVFMSRNNSHVQETVLHISSQSSSPENSNEIRLEESKKAIIDIAKHPLGSGPGTAGPASVRNDHPSKISENYFLQIGQEIGVVGMIIFIMINILVARELWPRRQDQLPKILLASLVGITLINLVSHAWTDDTLAYLWWGLAGVAIGPGILRERLKQNGKEH